MASPALYSDYKALLADPAVDAVVICTYDHGEIVAARSRPASMSWSRSRSPSRRRRHGRWSSRRRRAASSRMVGYMKLYDPGYEIGLEKIAAIGKPRAIHIHDFAGRFDRYGALYTLHRAARHSGRRAWRRAAPRPTRASRRRSGPIMPAIATSICCS